MDYGAFLSAVEAGRIPPVALLHGPEPFLLDDAVARVTGALFADPPATALSREVLEAREAGGEGIVRSALTLPLLSSRRLVVARGVDGLGPAQAEALVAYCQAPNPTTVLLLLAEQELGAAHWLAKAVPAGAAVAMVPPAGRALVSWLRGWAKSAGLDLDEEAATLLVQLVGDDLRTLVGEVDKAALAGGADNRRVGPAQVRAVVGEHRLRHIFELGRAIERRDLRAALPVLDALLQGGEEPLGLLGLLARDARAAWLVAAWLGQGRAAEDISRALRRPAPGAAAVIRLASALSPEGAARRLRRCWQAERRLKSGAAPRPELSLLIAELCRG